MTSHQSPATRRRSLHDTLSEAVAQLEREGVPSAPLAAELLLMRVLGRDRTWLYTHPEYEPEQKEGEKFAALIGRRASGVPTQHLTGRQEFWGLDFEVTPDTLIPRPETEHVIEVALARLGIVEGTDSPRRREAFQIADVGTGSGCIAVALAREFPSARIVATDISSAALKVAGRNAARHEVAQRISFIESNLLDAILRHSPVTSHQSRPFDLIASNPPYIARRDAATLPREVRDHEPEAALFGGETGTELYEPLIAHAAALLKTGGFLVLELGHDSAAHVLKLLCAPVWTDVSVTKDLAGIDRVASATRIS